MNNFVYNKRNKEKEDLKMNNKKQRGWIVLLSIIPMCLFLAILIYYTYYILLTPMATILQHENINHIPFLKDLGNLLLGLSFVGGLFRFAVILIFLIVRVLVIGLVFYSISALMYAWNAWKDNERGYFAATVCTLLINFIVVLITHSLIELVILLFAIIPLVIGYFLAPKKEIARKF